MDMAVRRHKVGFILSFVLVAGFFYCMLGETAQRENPVERQDTRRYNAVVTKYDAALSERLRRLVKNSVGSRHPELISLIREMIDPPSSHLLKIFRPINPTPQATEADRLLNKKRKGFYVECGALDGEHASNTLFLEQKRDWDGLLIEMDPFFYTQLRGKSRRAFSLNACRSPSDHPKELTFHESTGGLGKLIAGQPGEHHKDISKHYVPCFPLESILLALNRTKVDYFSLDVEGFELGVLQSVPFDRLEISVLSVEYAHGKEGKKAYRDFMEKRNYNVVKDISNHNPKVGVYVDDFIFADKKTFETAQL